MNETPVRRVARPGIEIAVGAQALMHQAAELDTIVVPTEAHALILEANLIKRLRPRFNVLMRDDKSFPYIMLTPQVTYYLSKAGDDLIPMLTDMCHWGTRHLGIPPNLPMIRRAKSRSRKSMAA